MQSQQGMSCSVLPVNDADHAVLTIVGAVDA